MKLNNIWGYGQLFGFSALDGTNRYYNDFIGTLTQKKIGIRFELKEWIKVHFPVKGRIKFNAITGDMIDAKTQNGDFFITFLNNDTLVGYSPVQPELSFLGKTYIRTFYRGCNVCFNNSDSIVTYAEKQGNLFKFAISHSINHGIASGIAKSAINANVEELKSKRYAYFKNMPKCKNKKYERLYYKALSVNKVNVRSAEGNIPCIWTTPDRVPHKHLWLWDSVFHALAIVNYNQELAKNAIRAVLSQAREDGFMPCTMSPNGYDDVTQPQVLSWGVWEVYKKTGDKEFLKESVKALDGYLTYDMKNRDKNGNGLLEWLGDPDDLTCKCGESGQDNSPRFDFDEEMDAIDFSTFACSDAAYLSLIYQELGDNKNAEKWRKISNDIKDKINELMWDDETGAYYDRLFDGKLTKMLTPSSFFPLFANIPSKEQAEKMVKLLTDEKQLWTKVPLATINTEHPTYSNDMWRGGVWLNLNYFIIKGLKNYGYDEIAQELLNKTLETVNKWYKKTGAIFEFYDPEDKVVPYFCERKGKPLNPPDWRKQVHSIVDFNWSACFTQLFIQGELY